MICSGKLPHVPRPVFTVHPSAKILIIGQAPGRKVHESGKPWDDASGRNLRRWLGVEEPIFYDPSQFAILPMGFCFPGSGKSGDLPPRPECAPAWHSTLLGMMPSVKLTLLIGQYAQAYYLKDEREKNLTETVRNWKKFAPDRMPLPHPSPRNRIWMRRNAWFEEEVIPYLQQTVREALD